ncbi:hypothetical protein HDV04_001721 [Boothiomyces sp. JEL0838]|nr:hypothetical protein HDV04_001721 [Boothiomyces sp. JEL0838]
MLSILNIISVLASALPKGFVGNFTYRGGPVISNVQVHPIFLGNSQVAYRNDLIGFYSNIVQSSYLQWLSEYTPSIGTGSSPNFIDLNLLPNLTLDDEKDIKPLLISLASNGTISPNSNTFYPIHLAPNVIVNYDNHQTCYDMCSYHNSLPFNGGYIYYAIIPDQQPNQGNDCSAFCGADTVFNNTCVYSSHELVEAIVDPIPGQSWYDTAHGEIADPCEGQNGVVSVNGGKYTVQTAYSMKRKSCVFQ